MSNFGLSFGGGRAKAPAQEPLRAQIIRVTEPNGSSGGSHPNTDFVLTQLQQHGVNLTGQHLLPPQQQKLLAGIRQALRNANLLVILGQINLPSLPGFAKKDTTPDTQPMILESSGKRGPKKRIITLGEEPDTLRRFWLKDVAPRLQQLNPAKKPPAPRTLKFFNLNWQTLLTNIQDLTGSKRIQLTPHSGKAELQVVLTPKAHAGRKSMDTLERKLLSRLAPYWIASNQENLEDTVAKLLKEKKLSVATAESCTGGLISSRLTDVAGSSEYIFLNAVTYSNSAKQAIAQVSAETLQQYGAVSAQTAAEMAKGIGKTSQCNIGLSITGLAGLAGVSEENPGGTAYIGLAGLSPTPIVKKVFVDPTLYRRSEMKYIFSQYALYYLKQYLEGNISSS